MVVGGDEREWEKGTRNEWWCGAMGSRGDGCGVVVVVCCSEMREERRRFWWFEG